MTAIVGLVYDGRVYLGGDSAATSDWSLSLKAEAKVWRAGPYVLGSAGSARMAQLLQHAFDPPAPAANLERHMATTFVDAVRACLTAGGCATKTDEEEGVEGATLVGVAGRLWRICGDYHAMETADGFDAIGCGDQLALGSLHSTGGQSPKRRIRIALAAAERFSAGVRGPFTIVTTKGQP